MTGSHGEIHQHQLVNGDRSGVWVDKKAVFSHQIYDKAGLMMIPFVRGECVVNTTYYVEQDIVPIARKHPSGFNLLSGGIYSPSKCAQTSRDWELLAWKKGKAHTERTPANLIAKLLLRVKGGSPFGGNNEQGRVYADMYRGAIADIGHEDVDAKASAIFVEGKRSTSGFYPVYFEPSSLSCDQALSCDISRHFGRLRAFYRGVGRATGDRYLLPSFQRILEGVIPSRVELFFSSFPKLVGRSPKQIGEQSEESIKDNEKPVAPFFRKIFGPIILLSWGVAAASMYAGNWLRRWSRSFPPQRAGWSKVAYYAADALVLLALFSFAFSWLWGPMLVGLMM